MIRTFQRFAGSALRHGGDDAYHPGLVKDFSLATNGLGPSPRGLESLRKAVVCKDSFVRLVSRYPQRTSSRLQEQISTFLGHKGFLTDKLLLGHGASELIDALSRNAPPGPFHLGDSPQYGEYKRTALCAGRAQTENPQEAKLICVVNPNNPTGRFRDRSLLRVWIEKHATPGSWVVVDESMLFWKGPTWQVSGVCHEWAKMMARERSVVVVVVHSWTKIFACLGLRIGSALFPCAESAAQIGRSLPPWSVDEFSKLYLESALSDTHYLQETWLETPRRRKIMLEQLRLLLPSWEPLGAPWLPWVWMAGPDEETARRLAQRCSDVGYPVRHYTPGACLRFAVLSPEDCQGLYNLLGSVQEPTHGVKGSTVLERVDSILPHEQTCPEHLAKLVDHLRDQIKISGRILIPSIVVDVSSRVILDGHHRHGAFRSLGIDFIPTTYVPYKQETLRVSIKDGNAGNKATVLESGLRRSPLPPKSTFHEISREDGSRVHISVISRIVQLPISALGALQDARANELMATGSVK